MKRTTWRWIAAASCLLAAGALPAARRPHYGGTLRVELSAAFSPDPAKWPVLAPALAARDRIMEQVFETLVRLNDKGVPEPALAVSWTHEPALKRWVFTPRPNVRLHNGALWEPEAGALSVPDQRPIEEILRRLADPRNAVVVRGEDGALAGTGPFRIDKWGAGKLLKLSAHEAYWGGRPFLDSVEIQMARPWRNQALDFESGAADVIELSLEEERRVRQRGGRTRVSAPRETLALVFRSDSAVPEPARRALALSIDRGSIHSVLLQKQGEATGALLPQWLSGYAFLFPAERDRIAARRMAGAPATITFEHEGGDALLRLIAERIALNASEAGITLRAPSPGARADVRLTRLHMSSLDPVQALEDLAATVKTPVEAAATEPYPMESLLLEGARIIPLFHLPSACQIGPRVRNWPEGRWTRTGRWQLDDVWLEENGQP